MKRSSLQKEQVILLQKCFQSLLYVYLPIGLCHTKVMAVISIGLSVFEFDANEYKLRAIWLHLTICNIWSPIR
jgi:hypothetical protein